MHTCNQLKKEFIKKWVHGLQLCCSSKKPMNLLERKKKIKLSADIALASAKNASTSWSHALISNANKDIDSQILVLSLSGPKLVTCHKRIQSKKILKKSYGVAKRAKKMGPPRLNMAACVAKRLVKKRTQVLKRLVPGGESMDELSLIKEALDYILSLKVQVDVMRSLVNASENMH